MMHDLKAVAIAGLAATLAFDIAGWVFTGKWWSVSAFLGTQLGLGFAAGALLHYANGVILAVLFAGVSGMIPGPDWSRPFTFITVHTVFGVWLFAMPLAGLGIGGISGGAMKPVELLVRHWVYAAVLSELLTTDRPRLLLAARRTLGLQRS